jgi:8-oxo-dGTP pyrophosphatase MutT (NUDIX family)
VESGPRPRRPACDFGSVPYGVRVLTIDRIRTAMPAHSPARLSPEGNAQAAVAMILREVAGSPEVFFIERARHERDPWSGHIAFPGGRVEPDDPSARHAAERETLEEVGIGLDAADYLGQLDDLSGLAAAARNMVVSAHVYYVADPHPVEVNYEVASAFWTPVPQLLDPGRQIEYRVPILGHEREFPGVQVGDADQHVLWGLTYRFAQLFLAIFDEDFPERP